MKLSLGPVLFYWTREKLLNFYAEMLEQPLDVIYLGETVCSKRRAFGLDEWLGLARDLRGSTTAELVISGLALVEAASELSSLRRLCDNGELLVEANDMGAVQFLSERKLPFVAGPALNVYNGHALAELIDCGMQRWVPPVECSGALIQDSLEQLDSLGVARPELELFAYGHLPLAYSARCFTARAENRPKDQCQLACLADPQGRLVKSQEGEEVFVLNGIQTQSGSCYNLLADIPGMQGLVDVIRLSPQGDDTFQWLDHFATALAQGASPLPRAALDKQCNGYWHKIAGMHQQSAHD